jgi:hypothetical protein
VVETLRLKGELALFRIGGSMLPKHSNGMAMRRIISASFAWAFLFFGSTWLIAMLSPAAAIEGKIPVGFVLLGIAVGGISIPINLAIHGVVLEHIFRVKRKRTGVIGMSFVLLAAASTEIGLSLVDFLRDHHSDVKLFFAIPIPLASIAMYWLHFTLMPKRMK